jgi:hypothetical protein
MATAIMCAIKRNTQAINSRLEDNLYFITTQFQSQPHITKLSLLLIESDNSNGILFIKIGMISRHTKE